MRAFRIRDVAKPNGPIARATLYKHASEGRLVMRKVGGVTVILENDWLSYIGGTKQSAEAKQK